jgi:hypothetical protein
MSILWFHWPLWLRRVKTPPSQRPHIPLSGPVAWGLSPRLLLEQVRQHKLEPRPGEGLNGTVARPCSLFQVRVEFAQALHDVPSLLVGPLTLRIHRSRSLRELWHLRASVRALIAQTWGEDEAQRRLARLQRHFPRFAYTLEPARAAKQG